jgi:hypothetical protein
MNMNVCTLVNIIQANKCEVRLKVKGSPEPEGWNSGVAIPVSGYIEINGPWPIHQVDWVEINPVVMEYIGRLVPPRKVNSLIKIESELSQANLLYTVSDNIIRVPLSGTAF